MPRTYVEKIAQKNHIPITDAKTPARVKVTATDVVLSQKANSKSCALSRASKRLPGVKRAYFFRGTAYLEYPDRIERFKLAPSIQKEIVSFDRAKMFAPGEYQLTPPSPSSNKKAAANYRAERKQAQSASTEKIAPVKSSNAQWFRPEPLAAKGISGHAQAAKGQTGGGKVAGIAKAEAQRSFGQKVVDAVNVLKAKKFQHRTAYVRNAKEPK